MRRSIWLTFFFLSSFPFRKQSIGCNFGCDLCWFCSSSDSRRDRVLCEEEGTEKEARYSSGFHVQEERRRKKVKTLLEFLALFLNVLTSSTIPSEKKQLGALLNTLNKSKLNFSYEVLEKATNYFHDSNKLGQGGSGAVYKVMFVFVYIVRIVHSARKI